jgi:hypothetical protein
MVTHRNNNLQHKITNLDLIWIQICAKGSQEKIFIERYFFFKFFLIYLTFKMPIFYKIEIKNKG